MNNLVSRDDVIKYQQAFLVSLPGMGLAPPFQVVALRNVSKQRLVSLVGSIYTPMPAISRVLELGEVVYLCSTNIQVL